MPGEAPGRHAAKASRSSASYTSPRRRFAILGFAQPVDDSVVYCESRERDDSLRNDRGLGFPLRSVSLSLVPIQLVSLMALCGLSQLEKIHELPWRDHRDARDHIHFGQVRVTADEVQRA